MDTPNPEEIGCSRSLNGLRSAERNRPCQCSKGVTNGATTSGSTASVIAVRFQKHEGAQAARAEIKIHDSVFEGSYGKSVEAPKLRDFIADTYLPWAKANKRTWVHDEFRSRPLIEAIGSKTMDEISPILIEKYKRDRRASKTARGTDRAPSTVNRELELLSKMFSLAIDQGLAILNPCRKVKRYREDNERNRYLSDEEESRLIAALDSQRTGLRPLVVLAIHTGMRRGELLSLRWANIDFERGLIHVMNSQREQTKTGHSRSVPMNQVVRAELQALACRI